MAHKSKVNPVILLEKFEDYLRMHAFLQAILFVALFFSALNILYTVTVVVVIRSWLITWWIDRRFPFCLIPMWAFLLVSIAFFLLGIYYYPRNRPKLHFDKINKFLICITISVIAWIALALGLTHTLYIGDFNVLHIIQNAFSGSDLLVLSWDAVDVFPTLGDTVLIGYILAFFFSSLTSWRALRTVRQDGRILVLGRPNMHWQ